MLLLLLAGCPKPNIPPGQAVVEDIVFPAHGVLPLDSAGTLRAQMEQQASRRLVDVFWRADVGGYVGDVATLDEGRLDEDGARIEAWYHNHGWFDAKFQGWKVKKRHNPAPNGGPRVDLYATIDRGPRSRLDTDVEYLGGGGAARKRDDLGRAATLHAGDPFDVDAWHETVDGTRTLLQERGFAWAKVDGHVVARPEDELVHATISVDHGPPCTIGPITVSGEGNIPESRIREVLALHEDQRYQPSKLDAARQRLYALGVYALVEVAPDLSVPGTQAIPILVRLKRRPSRTVQAGGDLTFETDRQELAANVLYTDDDVLGKLWRMELSASAGAATTIDVTQAAPIGDQALDTVGPVVDLSHTLTIPGLAHSHVTLSATGKGLLGVEPGYHEGEIEGSPAVTWTPSSRLTLSFDYRAKYHHYFDYTDLAAVVDTRLGATVYETYWLSIIEQKVTWDSRDNLLAPRHGWYTSWIFGEAGGPLGGDFDFFRPEAEVRGYYSPRFGKSRATTVLAGRVGAGVILPYVTGSDVDVDERLYLGGGNSVRGWGERRLGPYVCGETDCPADATDTYEPVGGNFSAYASAEVRQDLPLRFGVVGFVDVGRVWDQPWKAQVSGLAWTVGGGLRYRSPIGPIRGDFGYVLNPAESFTAQYGYQPWSVHLGIGEAF